MKYDFLVIPCGQSFEEDEPRLKAALLIASESRWIIVSGKDNRGYVISDWQKYYLKCYGIDSRKIVRERKARNTVTQIFRLIPIRDKKIGIISDKKHLDWVKVCCQEMSVPADLIDCEEVIECSMDKLFS